MTLKLLIAIVDVYVYNHVQKVILLGYNLLQPEPWHNKASIFNIKLQ